MLKYKVLFYLIGFDGFLEKKSNFSARCPSLLPWPVTLACYLGLLPWPVYLGLSTLAQIDPCMVFALYLDYVFLDQRPCA